MKNSLQNNFFEMGSNGDADNDTDEYCYSHDSAVSDYLMVPQSIIKSSGHRASYFCGKSVDHKEIVSKYRGFYFKLKFGL